MAESETHLLVMFWLVATLRQYYEGQPDVYRGNTHERGHSESSQFWRGPRARAFGSTKPMALKRSSTGTP